MIHRKFLYKFLPTAGGVAPSLDTSNQSSMARRISINASGSRAGDARTVRYFPDRLPIGIHPAGRGVVVYVVDKPDLNDFRFFLERHAAVLSAMPVWTLRIVAPPHFPGIGERAKAVAIEQLTLPLRAQTLDELRWFFEQTRTASACREPRFLTARRAFSARRFSAVYRAWKHDGEPALVSISSPAIRRCGRTCPPRRASGSIRAQDPDPDRGQAVRHLQRERVRECLGCEVG